nr:chloride intracellular channel protein 6-like [Aegilops tauschii subsp. strangulata]
MVGLQDPNRMGSMRLTAEQIARGVNDISKANLGEDWRFGKAPCSESNPTPQVSIWSSYFAVAHLLVHPDATREVLLNAIRHPYARAPSQVAPEEPAAHGGEEEAGADAGAGRRAVALGGGGGDAGGAGSSHGAVPSRPHGKDNVAPRPRAPKRTADPAGAGRPAKRKRGAWHGRPTPVLVLSDLHLPIALARAAASAAAAKGTAFRRRRSDLADQAEVEGRADSDLGLDPNDAEGLAWRDRNRAEAELEAASVRAWIDAAAAWARAGAEPAWREMPEGTVVAATVFEPSSVRERGREGRAEVVILDQEVVEVEDDTPPRVDVVDRAGADGGGGGAVLEEALQAAVPGAPSVLEEAPRAAVPEATSAAGPVVAQQAVRASGSLTAPGGASEEVLAASGAASGEHALPARSGGAVVFGPQTQEEAALDAVSRRLRGRTDRLEAFAQAKVERTRDLERAILDESPSIDKPPRQAIY